MIENPTTNHKENRYDDSLVRDKIETHLASFKYEQFLYGVFSKKTILDLFFKLDLFLIFFSKTSFISLQITKNITNCLKTKEKLKEFKAN